MSKIGYTDFYIFVCEKYDDYTSIGLNMKIVKYETNLEFSMNNIVCCNLQI